MARKLFGTDGIRGKANIGAMTPEKVLSVARAAADYFKNGSHRHSVVIGKDTRLSGYLIEPALTSGFISMGMDVVLVGPMPTPAVAVLTRTLRADLGVMISASHNPFDDNGIKLFGPDGYKLSDEVEAEIEARIDHPELLRPTGADLGRARRLEDETGRYIEFAKGSFPRGQRLDGMKIVVDCAHGAAYRVAPAVLWELGAEVVSIGVEPDGTNINDRCGATAPERMQAAVVEHGADIGIALDGDADRLILSDEKGQRIDGDQVMALIARGWASAGTLVGGGLVATVMSNLGLERHLQGQGLNLHRTPVGDRYVVEAMREKGFNVGGEQSGHLILRDYATTGDGLVAALQVLALLGTSNKPASELCRVFEPVPQKLRNIGFAPDIGDPLADATVNQAIEEGRARLVGGRILVRKSGTEPLIRIMAEADDPSLIDPVVADIAGAIEALGRENRG
ncbi:MAG: phosphoglucosamine mutase [Pseudomonadota bacterium]